MENEKERSLIVRLQNLDNIWFEYDRQNDILYINFGKDVEEADESILTESNIVVRIRRGEVISLTIFDFMKRIGMDLL
ncbi:MAG: DUF2283 domain-containing protein [Thermoprotei archaeon]|nr:MAG: DUF2283 domain-containing protein [Thermoprotei archaeon]